MSGTSTHSGTHISTPRNLFFVMQIVICFRGAFPRILMPKVQSRRRRPNKVEPFDTVMADDEPEITNQETEDVVPGSDKESGESNHAVFKRHAGEWKKMKAQVAQLKKQRKALTKKQRDQKKKISQDIKFLISCTRDRHDNELRTLGIVAPKRDDLMMDDEDE